MKFSTLTKYQQNQIILGEVAIGVAAIGLVVGGVTISNFPTWWIIIYNAGMGALLQFGISTVKSIRKSIKRGA